MCLRDAKPSTAARDVASDAAAPLSRVRRAYSLPGARGSGRRGSRTPKAVRPTRKQAALPAKPARPLTRHRKRRLSETGYRADGSPSSDSGPGRHRTCTSPGKSRELYRAELRPRAVGRCASAHRHARKRSTQSQRGVAMSRPATADAMLFMPLANPSTLDRRPSDARPIDRRPTWRGFGARASFALRKSRTLKHTRNSERDFQRRAPRVFLSQAGPQFELELLKLGIVLRTRYCVLASETTKATFRSPSLEAAMRLGF